MRDVLPYSCRSIYLQETVKATRYMHLFAHMIMLIMKCVSPRAKLGWYEKFFLTNYRQTFREMSRSNILRSVSVWKWKKRHDYRFMLNVLRSLMSFLFAPHKQNLLPTATPQEAQQWLHRNRFSPFCRLFSNFSGKGMIGVI